MRRIRKLVEMGFLNKVQENIQEFYKTLEYGLEYIEDFKEAKEWYEDITNIIEMAKDLDDELEEKKVYEPFLDDCDIPLGSMYRPSL